MNKFLKFITATEVPGLIILKLLKFDKNDPSIIT